MSTKTILTLAEFCEYCRISKITALRAIKNKEVRHYRKSAKRIYITRADADAYMLDNLVEKEN